MNKWGLSDFRSTKMGLSPCEVRTVVSSPVLSRLARRGGIGTSEVRGNHAGQARAKRGRHACTGCARGREWFDNDQRPEGRVLEDQGRRCHSAAAMGRGDFWRWHGACLSDHALSPGLPRASNRRRADRTPSGHGIAMPVQGALADPLLYVRVAIQPGTAIPSRVGAEGALGFKLGAAAGRAGRAVAGVEGRWPGKRAVQLDQDIWRAPALPRPRDLP